MGSCGGRSNRDSRLKEAEEEPTWAAGLKRVVRAGTALYAGGCGRMADHAIVVGIDITRDAKQEGRRMCVYWEGAYGRRETSLGMDSARWMWVEVVVERSQGDLRDEVRRVPGRQGCTETLVYERLPNDDD